MSASESNSVITSKKKPNTLRSQRKNSPNPKAINYKKANLLEMAEAVAHFGSWEWDRTKPHATWSPEMFRIFGLKPQTEGLTLQEFRSFIHPDDLEQTTRVMKNAFIPAKLNQTAEFDYRIIRPDGSTRLIHTKRQVKVLTREGKVKVIVGVDQDVTEQRVASQLSAERSKLLSLAERLANFGSWEWDVSKPNAMWSPALFRIFGLEPRRGGLTMEEYQSFIHPDDAADIGRRMQESFSKPKLNQKTEVDYRIIRPDGSIRAIHSQRLIRELTKDGKLKVIVGVDQDVTEQRQAVEALKKSEERFRIVAEAAHVGVYEIELKTQKILYMSDLESLTGYKPQETTWSLSWVLDHIHPDDVEPIRTTWRHAIANPKLDRYVLEYRFLHKNGQYITLKDTARTIKDATGKAVIVIGGVRDITQRRADQEKIHQYNKHLQELVAERTKQLVDYERFAAMGQVAGMVGHDIRNPLQALTGEVYLIRSELGNIYNKESENSITESLDSIDENINYINKIVADLQDYSRKINPEIQPINLENLIKDVFTAIKLPPKIQLILDLKAAPEIKADQTFLRRVLTNLINNAIQAMPDGGKLEISGYKEDHYACITVTDTGVGIADETKPKVFTPMFTTKAKGQGLGLAVVKRLVEAQGGLIGFESTVGKGTTFYVKLPINST